MTKGDICFMSIICDTSEKVKHSLKDVLPFIPKNCWTDTIRLYRVIKLSGAEGVAAWTALYRWLAEREHYSGIRQGLKEYFEAEIRGSIYGKGA